MTTMDDDNDDNDDPTEMVILIMCYQSSLVIYTPLATNVVDGTCWGVAAAAFGAALDDLLQ
jgi:hypothetical protein